MKVNLHTHTVRCGHAKGSEREYIEHAISKGLAYMGFSDHAPFAFYDGYESSHRVPMAQAMEYMDTLRALREEYKNDIKIYIGFEMEYYPLYFKDMLNVVNSLGAEYLLLGQHFIDNEYPANVPNVCTPSFSEEALCQYVDNITEGIESGVFTYVAHPDMFNFWGDKTVYDTQMRRICKCAVKNSLPIELNFLGLRHGRQYPNESFWRIAAEESCDVVYGFDAHDVKGAYSQSTLAIAEKIVDSLGLNIVEMPLLVDPKTKCRYEL